MKTKMYSSLANPGASLALVIGVCASLAAAQPVIPPSPPAPPPAPRVPFIFDTDIGNDVDDVLALGMIHSLQTRGICELLAVTITKDNELAAPYTDAINTFYGRGDIPIGIVKKGPTPEPGRFLGLARTNDGGKLRYPHDLKSSADAPDATLLLRKVLSSQQDGSVVIAQVGFSSNLERLLSSPADDISPLPGKDLAARKVKLLSVMAGAFQYIQGKPHYEYNVVKDIPAFKKLLAQWPTPIVFSGYENGISLPYPAASIERDYSYVPHHPLAESYQLYQPTPHERPTWDLTSVLYGIMPDRGYFSVSEDGEVAVDEKGMTQLNSRLKRAGCIGI